MRGLDPRTVLDFLSHLTLDSGARWDVRPFQEQIVRDLCSGDEVVWLDIPEGNAKTTLTAGLCLAHAFFVDGANVPMAASSRDQTGTLLRQAIGLVRRSGLERSDVDGYFRCLEGHRRIECVPTGGRLQVFAADPGTGNGVIFSLAVLEELADHRDLALYRTWKGKTNKRDGQIVVISNAGQPGSDYETTKDAVIDRCTATGTVRRVGRAYTVARGGGVTMHRYALAPEDDVEDLELVTEANPLLAIEVLRDKRDDATWMRDHWARMTCGQAVRGDHSAIGTREWADAARAVPRDELDTPGAGIPDGQRVYAGLDVGWKHDTTAIVPLWLPSLEQRVLGVPRILTPPRNGTSLDPEDIHAGLLELHERNPIDVLVVDGAVGGEQLAAEAERRLGCKVVIHSNGQIAQHLVYERWMEALREGFLTHPDHPEMTRQVLNARVRVTSDGRGVFDRPTTSRGAADLQDRRVIDVIDAAGGAHSVAVGDLRSELQTTGFDQYGPSDFAIRTL